MNDSLSQLMDLIALGTSVVVALFLAVIFHKKAKQRLRAVPLFFLLLGPIAIAVHMAMHFIGVGIVASRKISAGSFTYDFRFYSLLLMAGVLSVLSIQLIKRSQFVFLIKGANAGQRLATCGWIVLVSAPTIPFTFIGSLPVQAVVIHLAAAFFVVKKRKGALVSIEAPLMAGNAAV